MNPETFRLASELFQSACDLPEEEQRALLDRECAGNDELRVLVEDLILSDREASWREGEHTRSRSGLDDHTVPEIPGYSLQERLGEGGMGVVWRAVQERTRRVVALKLLSSRVTGSDRDRARFKREIEVAAKLEHPGIARVYDCGVASGLRYYAMELVDGADLDRHLAEKRPGERELVALFEKLCRVMEHAHLRGVIHRDLKPSNVLVREDGQPVIVDFGLAKSFDTSSDSLSYASISLEGQVIGTPSYMSPEQAAGGAAGLDTRTDVYSLGVMLYRALSGRFPHDSTGSTLDLLRRIAESEATPLSRVCPSVDGDLEVLVSKALASDPDRRYGTAGDLADDLRRWLEGEPLLARSRSTLYIIRNRLRRHRLSISVAALLLVTIIAGAIGYVVSIRNSREEAERWAYGYRIQLAERAFDDGRPLEARSLLDRCPPSFRHWEWDFLRGQLDLDHPLATPPDVLDGDYSDDGSLLVVGRGRVNKDLPDSEVVLFHAADESIAWRRSSESSIEAVAFSPDDEEIWVGGRSDTLARLDVKTGAIVTEEELPFVREIVFSPDGRQVAMVQYGEGLLLRDLASGAERRVREAGAGRVRVSYSADSSRLLWSYDQWREATGYALVIHSRSGEILARWAHKPGFSSSSLHPDGDTAFLGSSTGIWIWDLESDARMRLTQESNGVAVQVSRDGARLYTAARGSPLRVWKIGDRTASGDLPGDACRVAREVKFLWSRMTPIRGSNLEEHPARPEIFATGIDPVRIDVSSNPQHRILMRSEPVQPGKQRPKIRVAPDGNLVALTCSGGVEVRSLPENQSVYSIDDPEFLARSVDWSSDGAWLVSAWGRPFNKPKSPSGKVRIDAPSRREIVAERDFEHRVLAVAIDPSRRFVAAFTGRITNWMPVPIPGELSVLALPNLEPVWSTTIEEERYVGLTLEFSPDGRQLALESGERLRIWDSASHELLFELGSSPDENVTAFAYESGGRSIAAVAGKKILELDARTLAPRRVLCTIDHQPEALAFSPDGKRLVTGGRGKLALLDTTTGEHLLEITTEDEIFSVEFSPDSTLLFTADGSQAFRAWRR